MSIKYPDIEVPLVGQDGNAFTIMGKVTTALRRNHVPETVIKQYIAEATAGDYDHLLQTTLTWVSVS